MKTPSEHRMLQAAMHWHERVSRKSATMADLKALTDWLEEDPLHADAYEAAEQLIAMDIRLEPEPSAQSVLSPQDKPRSLGIRHVFVGTGLIAAMLLIVILNFSLFPETNDMTDTLEPQTYATNGSARRTLHLADGTLMDLNVFSRVSVVLSDEARRVHLTEGEAVFSVSKDPMRPFWVTAGNTSIKVVGTQFNVLRHGGETRITVAEGVVDVWAGQSNRNQPAQYRLTRGQQFRHAEGSSSSEVQIVQVDNTIAWRDGSLIYDETPLSVIATDLGRYFGTTVVLRGDVGELVFTGVLRTEDEASVLKLLEQSLPVTALRDGQTIVISHQ